jgi:nicotinamide-nucleotide adenylyltransferase
MRVGVYPGSFNPPTVAHLALARAALEAGDLDRIDLAVSEVPLGKEDVTVPSLDDRIAVLEAVAATRLWLGVRRTPYRLLADIAEGYDALVVGADKWGQLVDPVWYDDSVAQRDRALARLPTVLVVPRPPYPGPDPGDDRWIVIDIDPRHADVSSTEVRAGRTEWMAPEAAAWDRRTGGWSDPARYVASGGGAGPTVGRGPRVGCANRDPPER